MLECVHACMRGGDHMLLIRVVIAVLVGIFAALQAFADEGGGE
jgi:hypothetical protein